MTENEKRGHLMDAWKKIAQYVKDNYANVFPHEQEIEWKHEVYHKIAFMVTTDGTAYFCRGSHGWAYSPDEIYMRPGKNNVHYGGLEEIVLDWPKIKQILEMRAEAQNRIANFTI